RRDFRDGERPVKWVGRRGRGRRRRGLELRHDARVLPDRPADAALDEVLETRVAPGSLIVAPRGVKDSALALRADPRPRLFGPVFLAVFEDRAVLLVVPGVDVRLVPAFKAGEPFHDRVVRLDEGRAKRASAVALELRAHQVDVLRGILE